MLRALEATDLDFIAEMLADPRVMRFYPAPLTRPEARGWLERQWARYAADGHGHWLVAERASGQPVGQVGLLMQTVAALDDARLPEIGYLLHAPHWGRGYATEAAVAVREYAFRDRRYPHVISLIRPENVPSQRVAQRLGMRITTQTDHAGLLHDVWALDAPDPSDTAAR